MSVPFTTVVPDEFKMEANESTSKSIIRKQLIEVLPVEQATFTSSGNDIIRFNVSSNTDFLLGDESYFRFNLKRTDGAYNNQAALDVGGANALFRNIEVRSLASGVLLQRYDYYNRYYALKSLVMQKPEDVDYWGAPYGDSVSNQIHASAWSGDYKPLSATTASVTLSAAGALELGAAGRALSELKIGDMVFVQSTAAAGNHSFQSDVTAITDDGAVTLAAGPETAIAAGGLRAIFYLQKNEQYPARLRAVQNSGTNWIINMKPLISLLKQNLPLFLMKNGIEIALELDDGNRAISSVGDVINDTTSITYEITNPRFMAMLATPHQEIVDEYVKRWNTEDGLLYHIPSVRTRRITGQTTEQNQNHQMNFGVRSARRVYTVVQDTKFSEGTDALCRVNNSLSQYFRSAITQFQYKVGSHEFPHRAVTCDQYSNEALEQLKLVSGSQGFRFQPNDWWSVNTFKITTDTKETNESKHFIMCADLSRDNGAKGGLSGTDLSRVPLDIEVERSDTYSAGGKTGAPIYFTYCEHDSYLKLSSAQVSILN